MEEFEVSPGQGETIVESGVPMDAFIDQSNPEEGQHTQGAESLASLDDLQDQETAEQKQVPSGKQSARLSIPPGDNPVKSNEPSRPPSARQSRSQKIAEVESLTTATLTETADTGLPKSNQASSDNPKEDTDVRDDGSKHSIQEHVENKNQASVRTSRRSSAKELQDETVVSRKASATGSKEQGLRSSAVGQEEGTMENRVSTVQSLEQGLNAHTIVSESSKSREESHTANRKESKVADPTIQSQQQSVNVEHMESDDKEDGGGAVSKDGGGVVGNDNDGDDFVGNDNYAVIVADDDGSSAGDKDETDNDEDDRQNYNESDFNNTEEPPSQVFRANSKFLDKTRLRHTQNESKPHTQTASANETSQKLSSVPVLSELPSQTASALESPTRLSTTSLGSPQSTRIASAIETPARFSSTLVKSKKSAQEASPMESQVRLSSVPFLSELPSPTDSTVESLTRLITESLGSTQSTERVSVAETPDRFSSTLIRSKKSNWEASAMESPVMLNSVPVLSELPSQTPSAVESPTRLSTSSLGSPPSTQTVSAVETPTRLGPVTVGCKKSTRAASAVETPTRLGTTQVGSKKSHQKSPATLPVDDLEALSGLKTETFHAQQSKVVEPMEEAEWFHYVQAHQLERFLANDRDVYEDNEVRLCAAQVEQNEKARRIDTSEMNESLQQPSLNQTSKTSALNKLGLKYPSKFHAPIQPYPGHENMETWGEDPHPRQVPNMMPPDYRKHSSDNQSRLLPPDTTSLFIQNDGINQENLQTDPYSGTMPYPAQTEGPYPSRPAHSRSGSSASRESKKQVIPAPDVHSLTPECLDESSYLAFQVFRLLLRIYGFLIFIIDIRNKFIEL